MVDDPPTTTSSAAAPASTTSSGPQSPTPSSSLSKSSSSPPPPFSSTSLRHPRESDELLEPISESLSRADSVPLATLTRSARGSSTSDLPPLPLTTSFTEHGDDDTNLTNSHALLESDGAMPARPPSLLSSGVRAPSYGAVSQTPSANVSPEDSDGETRNAHPLRTVPSTIRSTKSTSSLLSRGTGHLSEDLDTSALASGPDGRFGVAQTSLPSDVLNGVKPDLADDEEYARRIDDSDDDDSSSTNAPPDDSPYDVVRASVSPTDNWTLSINTPRMWTLSVLFSILGSSTNLFFSLRYPSVTITPVIALLLVHPLGLLWDFFLKFPSDPKEEFVDGKRTGATEHPAWRSRLGRLRLWLAQGRWNEKEHTCVYVSSNVSFGFAFATDVIVEQSKFYNQEATITYQLLLTLSSQILGYAFAGLTRRFLVRPGGMIWPGTLMSAAMFGTLHKEDNKVANGWTMSRWKFFYVVWIGAFVFYFFPGLLMPCLSYFSVLTWIWPKNVVVANLFGVSSGLGLFPITFDWAQITYIGSPLLVPFWAAMNVIAGMFFVMWLVAPIAYYGNLFYSSYMPMVSTAVFDNTGVTYNVSRILTKDFLFDREAYSQYSKVFLPITYALSYGLQFAGLSALLTHTACWHGKEIWQTWKHAWQEAQDASRGAYQPLSGDTDNNAPPSPHSPGTPQSPAHGDSHMFKEDVHCRLMKRYPDAPISWYLATFVSMLAIGMFIVEYYPIHLPWYGLLLALGICAIFFIPNGIIMAVTNQHSSIYLICQLVCGVVFPGRPIANMVFTTYGYISSAQGIKFASDLKLGHYMKIPPRTMFTVQMVATVVSSITQIGVLNWMFANVPGICTMDAVNGFNCPLARVHFNGSILWGVVGPKEFFGPDATYRSLVWFFLLGAIAPIPLWMYARRKKNSIVRKIHLPLMFGSLSWIPPATGLNFSAWAMVCYIFNYHIKRRAGAWWAKYTMTMSAALDSGLAFGIVIVFFGFIYPGLMDGFKWWGTEVYKETCDWQACSYKTVPEGGHFGPDTW